MFWRPLIIGTKICVRHTSEIRYPCPSYPNSNVLDIKLEITRWTTEIFKRDLKLSESTFFRQVVGEYFIYSSLSVNDVLRGLYNCLTKDTCSATTTGTILMAILKVFGGSTNACSIDLDRIRPYIDMENPDLRQVRCWNLGKSFLKGRHFCPSEKLV